MTHIEDGVKQKSRDLRTQRHVNTVCENDVLCGLIKSNDLFHYCFHFNFYHSFFYFVFVVWFLCHLQQDWFQMPFCIGLWMNMQHAFVVSYADKNSSMLKITLFAYETTMDKGSWIICIETLSFVFMLKIYLYRSSRFQNKR